MRVASQVLAEEDTAMSEQDIDWQHIGRELAADFPPNLVEWRPQGKPTANAPAITGSLAS